MIKINTPLLDEVTAKAQASPRLRMNHNFHAELEDPVQRLLNALEPGTYIRPHKHAGKEESFVLLRGAVLAVVFNDDGTIRDHCLMSAASGNLGAELEADAFHTLVALESGTAVFEIKEGPYVPHTPTSSAPWAPPEGSPEGQQFLTKLLVRIRCGGGL